MCWKLYGADFGLLESGDKKSRERQISHSESGLKSELDQKSEFGLKSKLDFKAFRSTKFKALRSTK